ncbi:serine/threonine-protein kinase ATR [Anthonomus grandis grandis]|uniref:serine/threonine-protein kinase ATR n=1 Tax=Anthonomus grandis grandis TaxID=2921223 RepID=UPI0021658C08|nr:serine/threonine-protein kinase ATR [Anthonomus grandis grandis]
MTLASFQEAFPMWKMLDELVDSLLSKPGPIDKKAIQSLTNTCMHKKFIPTFICQKDPTISFKEYEDITEQYFSFTSWLLGHFFYLLSRDDDEILVDAQLFIIDQLSRTQLHIYARFEEEYCKASEILCGYLADHSKDVVVNVFDLKKHKELSKKLHLKSALIELKSKQMCLKLIEKLLRVLKFILLESSILGIGTEHASQSILKDLLFLLSEGHFELKIFDIFSSLLGRVNYNIGDCHSILRLFFSLFEQFLYDFYNNQNPTKISESLFDAVLVQYLETCYSLKADIGQNNERITSFLVEFCLSKQHLKVQPCDRVKELICKYPNKSENFYCNEAFVDKMVYYNEHNVMHLMAPKILEEISSYHDNHTKASLIDVFEASATWKLICNKINLHWSDQKCTNLSCTLQPRLQFFIKIFPILLGIRIKLKKVSSITFFNGNIVIPHLLSHLAKHYANCSHLLQIEPIMETLTEHLSVSECQNMDIIYHLIGGKLLMETCYKATGSMPTNYIGPVQERAKLRADIGFLYEALSNDKRLSTADVLKYINRFFYWVLSGLIKNFNRSQIDQIELLHMKVLKNLRKSEDPAILCQVLENIPHLLNLFSDKDQVITSILLKLLPTTNPLAQEKIAEILPTILCTASSYFIKQISTNNDSVRILCKSCLSEETIFHETETLNVTFSKNDGDVAQIVITLLKTIIQYLSRASEQVKVKAIQALPSLSEHIGKFSSPDVTNIWIECAGDKKVLIRKSLIRVIRRTVQSTLRHVSLRETTKTQTLDAVLSTLLRLSKKSLQYSEYELQNTLIETVDELGQIENSRIKLECMRIFLYFVMVPTSMHRFIAVSRCAKLSDRDGSGILLVYKRNIDAICETIVHLCYCNQYLISASLQESLVHASVIIGYNNAEDLIRKSANKLLPHLVSKTVVEPNVTKLIEEMAGIMEMDLSELIARNYGDVFLHLFLGDMAPADSKKCLNYLENCTHLSGPRLRKQNIKVILNELLLNFHEKRQKVLTCLKLLLDEDNTTAATSIEEYLQPYFLAFLLYFDLALTSEHSKKDKILLSLADLLRFMGTNRIMPLRFKILSMFQTAHFLQHPETSCEVWDAFIRTCELDCLGPHLAAVFSSMLPLIEQCPNKVNKMFQYLIVGPNEHVFKEFIPDLFFVSSGYLASDVAAVIGKYVKVIDGMTLKERIQKFLRNLQHDALEVRMHSLKQLKRCFEENREELDEMILGYNGIDGAIVELIDYLTLGCREKDLGLKLACGELFGELGAIEPSNLPRRYTRGDNTFVFFITEDAFIERSLNELIKAFQTDKNARNTDRVALAIQEILNTYQISPDESKTRHFMWNKFSEAQRDVMTPLLSSKYICVEKFTCYPCPLYGTSDGSTFQSWIYNWTSSLINILAPEEKSLLQSCLPSMKLDKRVLMHFLPYILLHSLLEEFNINEERCFIEFNTILESFNSRRTINEAILNNRPIPSPVIKATAKEVVVEEEKQAKCTKVVFILLDFLDRWLREWLWQKGPHASLDKNYQTIRKFMKKFCKLDLAKCNYKCGEYPRALMYLEDYITENPNEMSANLQFLGEIYAQLDEPDGVLGVEPLQQEEPSLEQKLLALEVSGKLNDAVAIYERMPRPLKLQHIQGLLQCYLDLDKLNTALYSAEGALELQPEFSDMLFEMQAEALWRLGSYDDLDNLLSKPGVADARGWGVQVGRSLICIKNDQRDEFKELIESLKKQQVESFGATSLEEGAYHHGYGYITRLHCLNELEQLEKTLNDLFLKPNDSNYAETIMTHLSKEWQLRIKVVQESVRIMEPLLCIRRVALSLARNISEKKAPQALPYFDNLLGEMWLQSVNVARSAGVHQAYTYVLDAQKYNPPKLFIEKAKLHWLREEHEEALITLRRGLNLYIPDNINSQESQQVIANLSLEKKKLCAEARLLIATYNDDICSVDVETNLQQYKEANEVYKEWEKSIVCLAQYQDRIFQNYSAEERDTKANELQLHIVHNFGKSLYYGTTYVYQSMPRLLSIWFDYGTRLLDVTNNTVKEERRNILIKMTKIIDSFLNKLPAYVFLTSFSQIISRIAHPQKEVYMQLKAIIIKLMQHYPQQCLWMISSVIKSSYPIRAKRCAEILGDPRLKTQSMSRLIKDFTSLTEKLIELCNKEIPTDVSKTTVSLLVRALPRMLNKGDFSEIMMPTHKFRKLILPNPDFKNTQHNPFPNRYVHIAGIDDEISVLTSLQRPRKISFRGSDGHSYTFMLKPKDDLRKDFRLMEFNDIVNHLLQREAEARQRRLNIRLYSVAPLNEECGLIEWVNDLIGLRPILMSLYKQKDMGMRPREIKEVCCNLRDPLMKKREVFKNVLLKNHPPVLGDWFRKTFHDAQTWLTARTGYIRTTAVISITGYMLGLGDRHGENILLDSTCGDVVHVDFNCLFNKGETFEWPERVPFRLTQNMIAAMGPLGVEGVFRKSCEVTLKVLRSNTATLMSIVTPFVYDPLVSWPRNAQGSGQNSEKVNEQALEYIKNIELRLQGKVKTRNRTMSHCLSIEGQIDYLINEAKSLDNLCQMYIGWGPYL